MLFLLLPALASDRVEESDTLAMGSTTVAAPHSNGVITGNPGALGLADRYSFQIGFGYGRRGIHWQVGAVDTKTSPVALGLTYSGDRYHPPLAVHELPGWQVPGQKINNRKRTHDVALALAMGFFDKKLSIGLGGSISFFNNDRQGKGFTGNLGAGFATHPVEALVIGFSARNLLPVPDPARERPMEFLLGAWLGDPNIAAVSIEGGVRPEFGLSPVLAAGAEVTPSTVSVRAGWRYEDSANNVTLGIGGGSAAGRIDLGLLVPTPSILKPLGWTVQLSVRFRGPSTEEIPEPR